MTWIVGRREAQVNVRVFRDLISVRLAFATIEIPIVYISYLPNQYHVIGCFVMLGSSAMVCKN